jgi:hypothetical protein
MHLFINHIADKTLNRIRIVKNNSGGVLVLVMGMITIMLIMGTTFLAVKGYEQKLGLNHKDSIQARMLSEAGVALIIDQLNAIPSWRGNMAPLSYFGGMIEVSCYEGMYGEIIVISSGSYGNASKETVVRLISN